MKKIDNNKNWDTRKKQKTTNVEFGNNVNNDKKDVDEIDINTEANATDKVGSDGEDF